MSPENEKFDIDEILNESYDSDEIYTLEAILSEYKGSAFIEGERKTPPELLDEQVESIISEVTGRGTSTPGTSYGIENTYSDKTKDDQNDIYGISDDAGQYDAYTPEEDAEDVQHNGFFSRLFGRKEKNTDSFDEGFADNRHDGGERINGSNESEGDYGGVSGSYSSADYDIGDSNSNRYSAGYNTVRSRSVRYDDKQDDQGENDDNYFDSMEFADRIAKNVDNPDWEFPAYTFDEDYDENKEETKKPKKSVFSGFLSRVFTITEENEDEEEPSLQDELERFSDLYSSMKYRIVVSGILCVLILLVTSMAVNGKTIPLGIGTSVIKAGGAVLILQLVCMATGIDVLVEGFDALVHVEPNAETLVLISNSLSFIDGFIMLIKKDFSIGMPLSAVSSVSLFFAIVSRRAYYKSMVDSIKLSTAVSSVSGVISEEDEGEDRLVAKKVAGKTNGFYQNLVSEDISEQLYFFVTPLIIILGFIFAYTASVGSGQGGYFAHSYALIMVVAAAFPSVSAYIMPFSLAVSSLKKSGCVLAGWCGACDIYDSDAALITDEDVFPTGSVSISGIKIFAGANQRKVIEYSTSLIIASKSGLSRPFYDLNRSQGFRVHEIEAFSCYEGGGIGGKINGENILVGSGAFMNLMGIRVPDRVSDSSTVFAAINDVLVAIYPLNYIPSNSVHSALESILSTKIDVLLAVKDFNVTPNVIQKKFKISMEGVEYLPIEKSYKLSDDAENTDRTVSALLCREGLAPLSEVISKGRNVKTVTELNTIISLVTSLLGMLIMFFLCKTAAFSTLSASNIFFFMIVVEIGVFFLSQLVKKKY